MLADASQNVDQAWFKHNRLSKVFQLCRKGYSCDQLKKRLHKTWGCNWEEPLYNPYQTYLIIGSKQDKQAEKWTAASKSYHSFIIMEQFNFEIK